MWAVKINRRSKIRKILTETLMSDFFFPPSLISVSAKSNIGQAVVLSSRKILRPDIMSYPVNMTCTGKTNSNNYTMKRVYIIGRNHQMEYQFVCL